MMKGIPCRFGCIALALGSAAGLAGCKSAGTTQKSQSLPQPVAAWSFARAHDGIVPDATGHGYDADIHGEPKLSVRSGTQRALEFDGSGNNKAWSGGSEDCGLSIAKRFDGAFTQLSVEAWVCKPPAWWMPVIYRDTWDEPSGFGLYTEWSSGKIVFGHYDRGAGHNSAAQSKTTVQDGTWHYVVGTMQPATEGRFVYRIYVDGKLDGEQTGTWSIEEPSPSGGILKIAYPNNSGADRPFNGSIGGIAIYDVALTPAQVKARFDATRGE